MKRYEQFIHFHFQGKVTVSIGLVDPNDFASFDTAPGDFSAIDSEGVEQQLESLGKLSACGKLVQNLDQLYVLVYSAILTNRLDNCTVLKEA